MMYLLNAVNIYDEEANAGGSMVPFLGFCLFVASIIIVFLSIVNIVTVKREFKLFYDSSELDKKPDQTEKKKSLKKNAIILSAGIVLMILSQIMVHFG
jgi:Ca2+/H+ antiporter